MANSRLSESDDLLPRPPLSEVVHVVGLDTHRELFVALMGAYDQAATGKGKERHASDGENFEDQQIVQFGRWMGSAHFQCGQAAKKALESCRLPADAAIQELYGVINYAAAAIIIRRSELSKVSPK